MVSDFETLIHALSNTVGVALEAPPTSPMEFLMDGASVTLSRDLRSGLEEIIMHSTLGTVPAERELLIYRVLLDANLLWSATRDATIGVNSATREAMICYRLPAQSSTPEAFVAVVAAFVEVARGWADYIAALAEEPEPNLAAPGLAMIRG